MMPLRMMHLSFEYGLFSAMLRFLRSFDVSPYQFVLSSNDITLFRCGVFQKAATTAPKEKQATNCQPNNAIIRE